MNEEYIGDGLYVALDAGMIRLRAPRDTGDHIVYLEREVLVNFEDFIKRMREMKLI